LRRARRRRRRGWVLVRGGCRRFIDIDLLAKERDGENGECASGTRYMTIEEFELGSV
jgi:hypothetical protein